MDSLCGEDDLDAVLSLWVYIGDIVQQDVEHFKENLREKDKAVKMSVDAIVQVEVEQKSVAIFVSPGGERYHRHRECKGLLQARNISMRTPCQYCQGENL